MASSSSHYAFLETHPLFKLSMDELVAAAFVSGFPCGGGGGGGPTVKLVKEALGALGLSKQGNKKATWDRLSDVVLAHPLPRAEASGRCRACFARARARRSLPWLRFGGGAVLFGCEIVPCNV